MATTKYIVDNKTGQNLVDWEFGATGLTFPDDTIQTTAYAPSHRVYTALLTQTGGDDLQILDSGTLTIGVTYQIKDSGDGFDFTNVGAPNNDYLTEFVATGTTPSNWGNGGQLIYNTGAPVVTVLENTIGNIWFRYKSTGDYQIISNNLFTNKTFINGASLVNNPVFNRLITDDGSGFVAEKGYFLTRGNDLTIRLNTIEAVETPGDNIIENPICLEIRVYN